ncbi:hypothetical protein A4X13_0g5950 [Tilletia indica]|uniref:TM7S3/TM198-like domain-containing protein n=1 Tax=Tilletia indica TaxID=43049 RepID=A0A177TFH7_9BASI|nr:hypothetical protein A4X13_0g5950 [Tilletia indica]
MEPRSAVRWIGLLCLLAMSSFTSAQVPGNETGMVTSTSSLNGARPGPSATARPSAMTTPMLVQNSTTTFAATSLASPVATPAPLPSASASNAAGDQPNDSLPLDTRIDGAFGTLGVLLILTGLSTALFGHRNRWSSFFMCGFYILALSTLCAILSLGVEKGVKPPSATVRGLFLLACLIAGIIGGVMFVLFYTFAAFVVCGLGGFALGLWLQALKSNGLIEPLGLRWVLLASCTASFFAAGCVPRIHNFMVLVATAFSGATALLLGIDCFSRAGIKEFYVRNLGYQALFADKSPPTFQDNHFPLVSSMQVELGVMAAVAAMGIAFQSRLYIIAKERINSLRDADRDRKFQRAADKAARQITRTTEWDLADWEARYGTTKSTKRESSSQAEHSPQWHQAKLNDDSTPTMTLPRLWFSGTTLRSPGEADVDNEFRDVEKNAMGASATSKASNTRPISSSFMSYVNGSAPPPVRGSFGRKASEQTPGLLPAVDTGATFSSPAESGKRPRSSSLRPKVAEERDTIMKEIAKIRASISELERGPQDTPASNDSVAFERPVSLSGPAAVSTPPSFPELRSTFAGSVDSHQRAEGRLQSRASQTMPVNSATFAWVQNQPERPVYVRSHSTQRSNEDTRGRPTSMAGPTQSRRVSQTTSSSDQQKARESFHSKSMSIDELQSRHRQRMRSRQRSVNDTLELQKAKVEWEQRQVQERTRMMDKVHQNSQSVQMSMGAPGKSVMSGSRVRARSIDWAQQVEVPDPKRSRPRAQTRQSTHGTDLTRLSPPMPTAGKHHSHRKSVAF